jgi:hypothetical protein
VKATLAILEKPQMVSVTTVVTPPSPPLALLLRSLCPFSSGSMLQEAMHLTVDNREPQMMLVRVSLSLLVRMDSLSYVLKPPSSLLKMEAFKANGKSLSL